MRHKISENISNILEIARLAPSSHNTQPWTVQIRDDKLVIGYAPDRYLAVGDPERRELFLSLGCFVETIAMAAPCFGYAVNIKSLGEKPAGVVGISLQPADRKAGSQRLETIKRRRSDRRHYQAKPLPAAVLKELRGMSEESASVKLFDDSKDIDFLAKMTSEATYTVMTNPAFREELAGWVRHNWTKQPDGMPGYTQGIPGPVSLFAKLVIRKNKKMAASQAKQDSQRVAHSAAIGLVCVSKDVPTAWLEAGRVYQRSCLLATKNDVKTAGTSAAVIVEETSKQIKNKLGLKDRPVALIRFGYTKSVPKAAPRRSVTDLLATS